MSKNSMLIALTDKNYETFLNELRQIVGENAVLTQSNISETYTQDWARDELAVLGCGKAFYDTRSV